VTSGWARYFVVAVVFVVVVVVIAGSAVAGVSVVPEKLDRRYGWRLAY
jgi:hypothetical protein